MSFCSALARVSPSDSLHVISDDPFMFGARIAEGFEGESISASWEPGDEMTYSVTKLDEELSAFFK